jgi:hypothetical protein
MTKSEYVSGSQPPSPPRRRRRAELPLDVALSQVMILLAGVIERVQRNEAQPAPESEGRSIVWKDDEYAYLESEVAGMGPDAEFDVYLGNGRMFARIKLGDAAEPTISITNALDRRRA